eukprot:PITA_28921
MDRIHPETCTHQIYTDSNIKPVRKPQRRMNPMLQDIVREELQKILKVNFIYPISDSQWVSPLVVVPKKNGKWRICVDYRQLNKATLKDYFPLPFIDQVLDTLAGKSSFSFLDGFSGYNQIRIALEDKDKTTFTCPWGTYAYNVLPFGLCNAPATFQRAVLAVFVDLVHDCVEVYMDDFSVYGNSFEHALENLEKVLKRCIEANLSLSNESFFMILNEGIVLGHYISSQGIKVDPSKIQIIINLPIPKTQKEVRSFLRYASCYKRFIEHFSKIALPLFKLLTKYTPLTWNENCQQAFETLKEKLSTTPVLKGPNWNLPFHIFTNASDTAVGASLGQKEESFNYAIYFIAKRTTFKILSLGYYRPSIFKDSKKYVKSCYSCERIGRPTATDEMPLQPQVHLEPFEKWALDFIGPINPISKGKKYILVCTDYLTKWAETKALVRETEQTVVNFLFEEIFANGQVESTNKTLEGIITKAVAMNIKNWEEKLKDALWAYRITWKNTTGFTPYQLVYGKEVMLPIEFQIHTYKMAADLGIDLNEAQQERIQHLNQLDAMRQQEKETKILMQKQRKQ